ncbi:MAG: hypothetical protein IPP69_16000 [Flavobacteriales bacterium]|nr:hypothetical protein [Flavobacteriales bacterium]
MKKALLFFAGVAIVASLSSCKKSYTCKCTVSGGGVSITTESAEFKATKKDAEDSCSATASAGGSSTTCEAVKK